MSAQSKVAESMEEGSPLGGLLFRLREGNAKFYAKDVESLERRRGIVTALNGVIEFLRSSPESCKEHLGVPLAVLVTALEDLEDGIVHPLLAPTKKTGRTPNPTIKKEVLGFIAAGLEMMVSAKIDKEEAAKDLANLLKKNGFWNHSNKDCDLTYKTVLEWVDRVKISSIDPDIDPWAAAAIAYHWVARELRPPREASAQQVKGHVLEGIGNILQKFRASDGEGTSPSHKEEDFPA